MKTRLLALTLALAPVALAPMASQAAWFNCTPDEILEHSNRLAVHCTNTIVLSGNTVHYLAISKANGGVVGRFLTAALGAFMSGGVFSVDIPDTSAGNTPDCGAANCRSPQAWGMGR